MNRVNLQLYNLARSAQRMFRDETQGWSSHPDFSISGSARQGQIDVTTNDQKFIWYDDGTRPHWIEARRAKMLSFRPGRGQGGQVVFAKRVYHPGTRAHNVSERVAGLIEPQIEEYIDRAISDAMRGT